MKKVNGKSLSVRLRKNSENLISNGSILLVWVTHRKFELEGLIRKMFQSESPGYNVRPPWSACLRRTLYMTILCLTDRFKFFVTDTFSIWKMGE